MGECPIVISFLRFCCEAKVHLSRYKRVQVVMGNPTCDLDSAISAITYALLCLEEAKLTGNHDTVVLPLLNIKKSDLPLKTEVNYWLKEFNITADLLITRSDLDLEVLHNSGVLELILVDHHVLSPADSFLLSSVVEIFDHRPPEAGWEWTGKNTILPVGSCCSLIGKEIIDRRCTLLTPDVCLLLYGPILLDTACLSPEAGRTSQLDLQVVSELEKCNGFLIRRQEIFQKLLDARSDISSLSPSQLLVKDLKIVDGVPISGLPILVEEFVKLSGVKADLEEFCAAKKTSTMMIMGLRIDDNLLRRDLAVYSPRESTIGQQLIEHLKMSCSPPLFLEPLPSVIPDLIIFKQGNIKASRKQIIPLVKTATECIENFGSN